MSGFQHVFQHIPEYRVMICQACKFAVVPDQAEYHIRVHHPTLSIQQRREILSAIEQLPDLARSKQEIRYPISSSEAIPGLPIYRDGFQCIQTECKYICKGLKNIQRHCQSEHGWTSVKRKGRPTKAQKKQLEEGKVWKEGISYQRFFEYAQWKRHFEVQVQREEEGNSNKKELTDKVLGEIRREVEELRRKETIGENNNRYQPNAWLDFTGWDNHLSIHNKESILLTIRSSFDEAIGKVGDRTRGQEQEVEVDEEEEEQDKGLAVACKATTWLIRKAIDVCQPNIVGREALMYVNRRETGEKDNERPFYAKQKVNTMKKYIDVWLKILRYI